MGWTDFYLVQRHAGDWAGERGCILVATLLSGV